jgi:signal transduction histidine kinase
MPTSRREACLVGSLVVALTAGVLAPVAVADAGDRQKQVLALLGGRRDAQLATVIERRLPSLLHDGLAGVGVDFYSEYLEPRILSRADHQNAYRDFLRVKYRAQHFDLVIAVNTSAVEFVTSNRKVLFPGTPIMFYLLEPPSVRISNSTGLVNTLHFKPSIDLALALQPDLRHVFVVSGAGDVDRRSEEQARREFSVFERRLELTYLSGLVTRDLEARLRTLPSNSAVYMAVVTKDGAGENFQQTDYVTRVASIANAPTYSWTDAAVDTGIVGGARRNQVAETNAIAALSIRLLEGARADDIPLSWPNLDVNQVDWRQLRRWGIPEARVPAGTTVLFREPGLWDRYQRYIIGSLALLLAQTMLIAALLVQRSKRRQSELELRSNETELRASYDRIQHLSRRLFHEQEEERARVARELHDDVCQQLACLVVGLEMLRHEDRHRRKADRALADAVDLAQSSLKSIRDLSHQLHSARLQLVGLVSAIHELACDLSGDTLRITFSHDAVPSSVPDDIALCLFRVAQEALRNVVKHSAATEASVHLRGQEPGLVLSIADNGVGFNPDGVRTRGLGLLSINERLQSVGGRLDISSRPGSGTQLEIQVPLAVTSLTHDVVAVHVEERSGL